MLLKLFKIGGGLIKAITFAVSHFRIRRIFILGQRVIIYRFVGGVKKIPGIVFWVGIGSNGDVKTDEKRGWGKK